MAIGSPESHEQSVWVHWFIPSVTDVLFVALLVLLAFTSLSMRLLGDAGIGWHIRTGQLILAAHAIPHTDPFSSSMAGHPWFAWEWLYDIAVGWLDRVAGLNGVVSFTAVIIAGTFAWTFRLLLRRGTNLLLAVILTLLAISAAMIHFQARPHVVSWLFALIWFWILDSSNRSESDQVRSRRIVRTPDRSLWLLPPLMLLWVNLHGGFLTGFALLAIYWLSGAWSSIKTRQDRFADILQKIRAKHRLRTLTLIGLLSALATFANPYGYKLHVHIYEYLSNRFLMDHIDEFQSPNFHYVAQKCFAVLLLLALVALAAQGRKVSASHGLVMLFAVYSGLYASRNIPVSSLLLVVIIGPWLSEAIERYSNLRVAAVQSPDNSSSNFLERMRAIELSLRGHVWAVAATLLTGWIALHGGNFPATPLMDAHFDTSRFPVAGVEYLESRTLQGPILAPDYWGGYLIYRLYPRARVVVDDRHDFYGEPFLKSYLKMVHVEPGWQDFLNQHPAQFVLVPKGSALRNILLETRQWGLVYTDDVTAIFCPIP